MPKVTEQIYEDAKSKFLTLQPEINEMAMKLKELKKLNYLIKFIQVHLALHQRGQLASLRGVPKECLRIFQRKEIFLI